MSDIIKTGLNQISADLNLIQTKKKELIRKYDLDSKFKIFEEIKVIRDRSTKTLEQIKSDYQFSSNKIRNEHKGAFLNVESEYTKMIKDVDKTQTQLKKERLIDKTTEAEADADDTGSDKYGYLANKVGKQNNNLIKANQMGKEITTTQDNTRLELVRQREKLVSTNEVVNEVEQSLSIMDQFSQVMGNRELYAKLKLVAVVVLLAIADLLVIFIKFRR